MGLLVHLEHTESLVGEQLCCCLFPPHRALIAVSQRETLGGAIVDSGSILARIRERRFKAIEGV